MKSDLGELSLGSLPIGSELGGCRVEAVLGRQSGVGRVYEATRLHTGERVALKVFMGRTMDTPAAQEHFEATAGAQARLEHPHVVSVYDWGTEPVPYMVMTLVQGTTLAGLLAGGALAERDGLGILDAVADALAAGQSQGLVYRRLQPSGVLVGHDDSVMLGDFGAGRGARAIELIGDGRLGTFADYISPEEVDDGEATSASCIYSLGAMVFEVLAGRPPFASDLEGETLHGHMEVPPKGPGSVRPRLSRGMDQAVVRALSKDPSLRQRTARELIDSVVAEYPGDVYEPEERAPAPAAAADADHPRRRPWLATAALTLAGVAGVAGAVALGAMAADGGETAPGPQPAKRAATADLNLRHPSDWRLARQAPELAGLKLADPMALTPATGSGELVAGRIASGGLPATREELVDLGGLIGHRYTGLREAGSSRRAVAYAVPSARGTVVAACLGAASGTFAARCQRVASTLRARREGVALAVASPTYARRLTAVVRRLDRVRLKGRRRLARARTPAGQRRITARLSRDYGALAGVLARIKAPGPARAPQRVALTQLRRAARGYRDMSRAARARSGRRWVLARRGVRSAEGNAEAALRSLRRRGYDAR